MKNQLSNGSKPLIEVQNLYKKFLIETENPTAFRLLKHLIVPSTKREFYALKNINFKLYQGDRIGLIGSNGSGKTTLLRILAGLYAKTKGRVEINGKVATFLHTDVALEGNLSALDNIYLLGMIMGINKKDIEANLKKIIDFAEIGKFIRTPLRDFSTGMIQRLVLSILMYVEADIFLLDEIVESGDIKFKHKCYKIILDKISKQGKAAIISSHETEIIEKFCNKVLLLDNGQLIAYGPTKKTINLYKRSQQKISE